MTAEKVMFAIVALVTLLLMPLPAVQGSDPNEPVQPQTQRLTFPPNELPPTLFNKFTGKDNPPHLSYRLPPGYSKDKRYPLILYVPGHHGRPGGRIRNAIDIADSRQCVVASLPLFKKRIDYSEPVDGIIVSFSDYPVISQGYRVMLSKLFVEVPNIDYEKSAMAGFSNGAITIAILVSMQDAFILEHFSHFAMVDHGMFHLCDLHKAPTREKHFLFFAGDQQGPVSDVKIRGAQLLSDAWQMLNIDIESRILVGVGHELTMDCKLQIGEWIFSEPDNDADQSP